MAPSLEVPVSESVLPLLKPADWMGRQVAVQRPLLDDPLPGMPLLCFGYDQPESFQFINEEQLKAEGRSLEALEAEAISNLVAQPARWRVVRQDEGGSPTLLVWDGDFLAAERLLDPAFLRDAQQILGAGRLALGAPCRQVLLAAADGPGADREALGMLEAMVARLYSGGESAPVAPLVFTAVDGELVGAREVEGVEPPAREDDDAPSVWAVTSEGEHGDELHLVVATPQVEGLAALLLGLFSEAVERTQADPDFGGVLRFVLVEDLLVDTPALRQALAAVEEMLASAIRSKGLTTQAGRPYQVQVRYGMGEDA